MNIKEYCQHLHNTKKSFAFYAQVKKDNREKEILLTTSFINDKRISAKVYCILHDITETPKCECGKELKFNQYSEGFREFCSVKCSSNSKSKQNKIKETNIRKYGHENAFHSPNGRKEWNNYVDDKVKIEKMVNRVQESLMENYGVNTIEEAQKIRMKNAFQANIDKHGFAYNNREKSQLSRNEQKMVEALEKTCLEKYGVRNAMQLPEVFEKFLKNAHKKKDYILPSGKIIKVQGFEPLALDKILLDFSENDLILETKNMPKIWYIGKDNKKHRYYPDIYIPKINKIVEVKSDYTLNADLDTNKLKEKACIEAGFNFEFMVFDNKGVFID